MSNNNENSQSDQRAEDLLKLATAANINIGDIFGEICTTLGYRSRVASEILYIQSLAGSESKELKEKMDSLQKMRNECDDKLKRLLGL